MPKPIKSIRFINTFEPVVTLYDEVLPRLQAQGIDAKALISQINYREVGQADQRSFLEYLNMPFGKANKRQAALLYALLAPLRLLFTPRSMNVFLTQPPLFYIPGAVISKLTGSKFVIHIMDFYPDFLVRAGVLKEDSLIFKLLRKASLKALNAADQILVIGRCMQDYLINLGVPAEKISVVPNWASRNVTPQDKYDNPFRKEHQLGNNFIVMYSGNMGTAHTLDSMLEVAKRLESREDIRFVFIGEGTRKAQVAERVAAGQRNVLLLGYQPYESLPFSLGAADVHFMSLRAGYEGLMVPSKFYGILASGRPVLYEGDASGEVARVIDEAACGQVIALDDADALEAAILAYANDPVLTNRHGEHAHHVYETSYAPDVGANRYIQALGVSATRVTPAPVKSQA